jgi:hypothetical protein
MKFLSVFLLFCLSSQVLSQDNGVSLEKSCNLFYSIQETDISKFIKIFSNDKVEILIKPDTNIRIEAVSIDKRNNSIILRINVINYGELHSYNLEFENEKCLVSKMCFSQDFGVFYELNPFCSMWRLAQNCYFLKYITLSDPDRIDEFNLIINML